MNAVRPARPGDADDFVRVVGACWNEYPGLGDIAREAPLLRALAEAPPPGGATWAAEVEGRVVGLIAAWPVDHATWELGRMYVDAAHRGQGLAADLLARAESEARDRGGRAVRLWSDTRLARAHAFYEKSSFVRQAALRVLEDGSDSIDFGFAKPLAGVVVRTLDGAGAESAAVPLARVLVACVEGGASVSFMQPLAVGRAEVFWRQKAREVAIGTRILLAAWLDGRIVGMVTLDCDTPENQPHRADLQKLLVHPAARRHGIARALMVAVEMEARAAGRTLLTLDTASSAAEALYRTCGWTEVGVIPEFALNPDGTTCDTVLFWKRLEVS